MRKNLSCAALLLACALLLSSCDQPRAPSSPAVPSISAANLQQGSATDAPQRCTVFTVAKGGHVFFGGNDDYINPDSYYWVDRGGATGYGVIWIGTPDNVQQGVNEKGLAYDANGLPRVDVNPHSERTPVVGGYTSYPIQIMRQCATVAEVIEWAKTHQWHSYMHDQMQFADASGDAVIISAGTDGELAFTRKPPGDGFLLSTNFNVANPSNGYGYPSPTYETAQEMLGQMVSLGGGLAVQDAARVLDAVHQDGGASWTLESLVADLTNGVAYLYYFYQFDRPVVLNVAEEIAHPRAPGPLSALFPEDVQQEAARRYQHIQTQATRCQQTGMAWLGLLLPCLLLLIALSARQGGGLVFWAPTVAALGPLGLLAWLATRRRRQPRAWRAALLEAVGDAIPTVVAFVLALVLLVLVPALQASQGRQIAVILGLPLLAGWLGFQAPLTAPLTQKGYARTLSQLLPRALVVVGLGLAGILAVALPLASGSTRVCTVMPLPVWTVGTWWAIAVLGALLSGLLLFVYEFWAVRHGYRAWSVLAWREGKVRSPSWRTLWWWIPLSCLALFAGLVVNGILQQLLSG
jgi:hypothetical protein